MVIFFKGRTEYTFDTVGGNSSIDSLIVTKILGEGLLEDRSPECTVRSLSSIAKLLVVPFFNSEVVIDSDGDRHTKDVHL